MSQNSINLFNAPFKTIFNQVQLHFAGFEYDYKRHLISLKDNNGLRIGHIRLPLHISISNELVIIKENTLVLYMSIESGNAAINLMEGKVTLYHTTFSAYMTRKKQGVSQIKYLNKKGKSRAGSRVRLAKSVEFFENINTTIINLFEGHTIERIALNCSTSLIPYLHNSKVACPFEKKDKRLYKIPLHIPQSNYTNLQKGIKKLMAPVLFFDEKNKELFEERKWLS